MPVSYGLSCTLDCTYLGPVSIIKFVYINMFNSHWRKNTVCIPQLPSFGWNHQQWVVAYVKKQHEPEPGGVSIQRCRLTSIGIPMLKIRRSYDRLIFNIGIRSRGKMVFISRRGRVPALVIIYAWPCIHDQCHEKLYLPRFPHAHIPDNIPLLKWTIFIFE